MDSPALRFGRALHVAVLEPDVFRTMYAVAPDVDRRTKEGKKIYADWVEEHADAELLSDSDMEQIQSMVAAVQAHPFAAKLFSAGDSEVSIRWDDPEYGCPCKARLDHWAGGMVADLKTCQDARDEAFAKSFYRYGYYMQAPFYLDALTLATGKQCGPFLFVAIEKEPPHGIQVHEVPKDELDYGRQEYKRLLAIYAECVRNDSWPGYEPEINQLCLPSWAMKG
jgi:exodeoxyribonuclease VIII